MKEVIKLRESLAPFERLKGQIATKQASKKREILNQEKVIRMYEKEKEKLKNTVSDAGVLEKDLIKKCKVKAKQRKAPVEIKPSRTVAELSAKLTQIRKKKKKNNPAEKNLILEEYDKLRKEFEESKRRLKNLEDWVNQLKDMMSTRTSNYQFIRTMITDMVARRFRMILHICLGLQGVV